MTDNPANCPVCGTDCSWCIFGNEGKDDLERKVIELAEEDGVGPAYWRRRAVALAAADHVYGENVDELLDRLEAIGFSRPEEPSEFWRFYGLEICHVSELISQFKMTWSDDGFGFKSDVAESELERRQRDTIQRQGEIIPAQHNRIRELEKFVRSVSENAASVGLKEEADELLSCKEDL